MAQKNIMFQVSAKGDAWWTDKPAGRYITRQGTALGSASSPLSCSKRRSDAVHSDSKSRAIQEKSVP